MSVLVRDADALRQRACFGGQTTSQSACDALKGDRETNTAYLRSIVKRDRSVGSSCFQNRGKARAEDGCRMHYHFYHLTSRIPLFLARISRRLQRNAKSDRMPKTYLPSRVSWLFGESPSSFCRSGGCGFESRRPRFNKSLSCQGMRIFSLMPSAFATVQKSRGMTSFIKNSVRSILLS